MGVDKKDETGAILQVAVRIDCFMPEGPIKPGNFSDDSVNISAGCKVLLLAILGNFCNSVLLLPPPQKKSLYGQTDAIK